jgi:hypothetical protein
MQRGKSSSPPVDNTSHVLPFYSTDVPHCVSGLLRIVRLFQTMINSVLLPLSRVTSQLIGSLLHFFFFGTLLIQVCECLPLSFFLLPSTPHRCLPIMLS